MTPFELIESRRPWLRNLQFRAGLTGARPARDNVILDRIVAAYRLASAAERDHGVVRGGPWSSIRKQHMGQLMGLLTAGHHEPLAEYLRELPNQTAGHGFFQGKITMDNIMQDHQLERGRLLWIMDSICGLAEFLGLLGVICPEAPPTIPIAPPSVEELVGRIERATGLPLAVPEVFAGLHGIAVGDGVVHMRSVCAVYAALRIRALLADREHRILANCTICEIGPGVGLVPAALGRLGADRMLLVDLPELNAIQAYFLSQTLPSHRLSLFGEPPIADGPMVKIMPDFEFLCSDQPHCDLVFNQDSLPEIDLDGVHRYLDRIGLITKYFLSFNQETRVPNGTPLAGGFLTSLVREGHLLRPLERMPTWCRAGYIDELFVSLAKRPD
jgi:hypothetical protein